MSQQITLSAANVRAIIDLLDEAEQAIPMQGSHRIALPDELTGTASLLRDRLAKPETAEALEDECDDWLASQNETISLASPEAYWATKAYLKARGFEWPAK